jgi:hypothetical protein
MSSACEIRCCGGCLQLIDIACAAVRAAVAAAVCGGSCKSLYLLLRRFCGGARRCSPHTPTTAAPLMGRRGGVMKWGEHTVAEEATFSPISRLSGLIAINHIDPLSISNSELRCITMHYEFF